MQQINSQRHTQSSIDLFLQDEIVFLREELVNKQNTIDKLLQVLTVDSKTIKRDERKVSHKSCQINLLTEKFNSDDKTINIYNDLRECVIDQSNKTKEISTQTEHEQNYVDDELLNDTSCDDVLANKNTKQRNAEAKINLENQLKEIRHIKHQNYTNNKYPLQAPSTQSSEIKHPVDNVTHKWSKNTTLIVGDSMISGIDETMISRKGRIVKVRPFSGATINNSDNIILHVGTNNAAREPARTVFAKIVYWKDATKL